MPSQKILKNPNNQTKNPTNNKSKKQSSMRERPPLPSSKKRVHIEKLNLRQKEGGLMEVTIIDNVLLLFVSNQYLKKMQ